MKPVFSKTTDKFILIAKLSDYRMKLFLDVDVLPPATPDPPAAPPPNPETPPEAQAGAATAEAPAAIAPPVAPPVHRLPVVSGAELMTVLKEFLGAALQYVNEGVVEDIASGLSKGERAEDRRIVKGEEPQVGVDGKILFLVKRFTGEGETSVDEKGFADFHVLKMFDNVSSGTIVARIYPPKPGVDGRDALGRGIPAKMGKPYKAAIDRTLVMKRADDPKDSYEVLVAGADGYLCEEQGKLSIKTEFVVSGNLDFHLGMIDFIGSVAVRGDVYPGFSIRAKSGIRVSGSVREASLTCPEGDIIVEGHIYGGASHRVVCGKNVECSVAQALDAEVVGSITVRKEALDCQLRAQGSVNVPDGNLVGGRTLTVCGAQAKRIGNEASAQTRIELCSDVEMTAEYMALVANIESHQKAMSLIDLHLGPYATNPARIELLAGAFRTKMQRLYDKHGEVERSLNRLKVKRSELLAAAHSNAVMRVNFIEKMYDGVVVAVGEEEYHAKEPIDGPLSLDFNPATKEFSTGELKGLECTIQGVKS